MAKPHDRAAKIIAKKLGGEYKPEQSPDVTGKRGRAEIKSTVDGVSEALRQLGGGKGPAYIALPKRELPAAKERLESLKTGLMDYDGKIIKPSQRKK